MVKLNILQVNPETLDIIQTILPALVIAAVSWKIHNRQKKNLKKLVENLNETFVKSSNEITNNSIRALQANLEIHFNTRYSKLISRAIKNADALESYHSTFWTLQYDEFLQFKRGHVSKEIFLTWMKARIVEFGSTEPSVLNLITQQGWLKWKKDYSKIDKDFYDFINMMETKKITNESQLIAYLHL